MVVGVTGIFGSGKTTVSKMLAKKGKIRVVNADRIAARVFDKREKAIKKAFGTSDRKKVGEIVFNDREKLVRLKKIVHPAVIRAIKSEAGKRGKINNTILDVPLLMETGMHKLCDVVIVVKCRNDERIKRLRGKFTLDEIRQRTKHQAPLREKIKRADFIVDNSGSIKNTEKQVGKIWNAIK